MPQFFKIRFFVAVFAVFIFGFLPSESAGANGETSPRLFVESGAGLISLEARNVETAELLRALAEKTKTDIAVGPGISGKISLKITAATIGDVLKAIGQNSAIVYEYQPDTGGWRVVRALAVAGTNGEKSPSSGNEQAKAKNKNLAAANKPETGIKKEAVSGTNEDPAQKQTSSSGIKHEQRPSYKAGELLVRFRKEASPEQIAALHKRLGSVVIKSLSRRRLQRIKLKAGLSEADAIELYRREAIVEHAERHALRYPQVTPNDPAFADQWGLKKIGMESVWGFATGSRDVVVAVIDTGVDCTHPDLRDNIWINIAEQIGVSGIDDDKNGYIDDIFGWDFAGASSAFGTNGATGDNDPTDVNGHGTHVAGIIGAIGNNGIGVSGINWNVRIMPLKVQADDGSDFASSDIIEAIDYAIEKGADIVNCSFGGSENTTEERNAFARLRDNGILAVCAAGNGGNDSVGDDMDLGNKIYPACYDLDNILSVASAASGDTLAGSSNYGKSEVDIAAPGEAIYSTLPLTSTGTTASVKTVETSVEYGAIGMEYAGVTPEGGITGTLYDCGRGYADEIPDAVSGNIALIQRGSRDGTDFYFYEKLRNAQDKNASGVIIYNDKAPEEDPYDNFDTKGGTLYYPGDWVPVVSVTKADGETLLALAAVGRQVVLINKLSANPYGYLSGTSMATPHVSGLAALLAGHCPSAGYAQIKKAILDGAEKIPALEDKIAAGRRLSAFSALTGMLPPGDLSGNCRVGLEDAIIALRTNVNIEASPVCPLSVCGHLDVNEDARLGIEDAIYILQTVSEIR